MRQLILCAAVLLNGVGLAQAGYLANAGFETQTAIPSGLGAATAGEWRGDPTVIVTAQDGIAPSEGQRMLQFVDTYPTGPVGIDSAVWQIIDVRPYADYIVGGDIEMSVTAQFNRVAGDSATDTEFGFFLKTMNSMPDQYPGYSKIDTFFSDGDPRTWETHVSSLQLPPDTEFLLVGLLAVENVFDNDEQPFDGHYADNVTLSLVGVPEPSTLALLVVGMTAFFGYGWRRKTRPFMRISSFPTGLAAVMLLCGTGGAKGGDVCYFMGPDNGSWHVPESWSSGHIPRDNDEVRIFDDLTVVVAEQAFANSMTVGYYKSGHVIQQDGNLTAYTVTLGSWDGGNYAGTFDLIGGHANVTQLHVGVSSGNNTFTLQSGDLFVRNRFWVGSHYNGSVGTFDQRGGAVRCDATLELGFGASNGTAVYSLSGGELTIDRSNAFAFGSGDNTYFDFNGGDLILPDIWDFDRLTSIGMSDFRVAGEPATEDNLDFGWAIIDNTLHTKITGVVEPSADFNGDGNLDLADANLLTAIGDLTVGVAVPQADAKFDLTGDDIVDSADLDRWLADAAAINSLESTYLRGDANLDGDVDVWAFDGSGDAQVLSSNLGTMTDMVWGDGDFNGDGDVDVWQFDGSGDAQLLSSNLGSTHDIAAATVPEASTLTLLAMGAVGLFAYESRRRRMAWPCNG